ncbi:hypothetical protein A3A46_00775 [Candidatus Roizmanbacteria bacterium RIFCSPLOWO2_01_FULL_37_13]|uniref:ATP-grasp domain-containing protein n=1 Tax=Candidatus Roizmanbacteria bacterium RIFCSPHIGHO2_02_FULL_38_11 TaxID=1802039 RepID=A0A1F7H0Q4_9BACT|nr:MAG: hypothetical protein A3C25_01495 [Candidatus Roizmanbacteria bacterium RIFCSPHIGHO2_02_FULL_38_11]OGK41758.1 MAG: hypothetical protein A3A46_00775 [Candidatus Roizmanbacteria bacterium RIFCSPLOWO2_01_FULL_37_13]
MKVKTLAFFYNVRRHYPDPSDPKTQLEVDFDDPPVIDSMIKHFENLGYKVIPIEANEQAYLNLYRDRNQIDFAFDYSFGLHGQFKYCHIPAMLEMLQIPFTSSSSFVRALTLNKVKMKQILLANDVSTLPYQLFTSTNIELRKELKFPLIVKPVAQGSSAGITKDSIVTDLNKLEKQVALILKTFKQPAFAEPFLKWREFSVGMLGNPPRILPIIQPDYSLLPKKYLPFDSIEVKWVYEDSSATNHLVCPAKIDTQLKKKIEEISLRTWEALEIRDLCRIDMRTDNDDNLYILDVNAPPGLLPPDVSEPSYFPIACRAVGIDYEDMLQMIIDVAVERYNT